MFLSFFFFPFFLFNFFMSTAITNANGAGSLLEDKRHSRSLDLSNSRNKQQHQRSASETDGIKIKPDIEQEIPSSSVFSLYKKLSIRQKSSISSAFSSLLQQDTKISNYRFSSPILNTGIYKNLYIFLLCCGIFIYIFIPRCC